MIIRMKRKYMSPKQSIPVPIIGHSGEVVIPVKTTSRLARWLNDGKQAELPAIMRELKNLINTVPTRFY